MSRVWCERCNKEIMDCRCEEKLLEQYQREFMELYFAALDFGANRKKDKAYENILWPAIRRATQSTLYNEDVIDYQIWPTKNEVE